MIVLTLAVVSIVVYAVWRGSHSHQGIHAATTPPVQLPPRGLADWVVDINMTGKIVIIIIMIFNPGKN